MKHNNKIISIHMLIMITLLSLIMIFFNSCGNSTSTPNNSVYKGTQGIVMNFMPNAPPNKIYDNTDFNIIIKMENKGISDAKDINIELTGFDQNLIKMPSKIRYDKVLNGISNTNPISQQIIQYTMKANPLSNSFDRYNPTIIATVCYSYKTHASLNICLDPNPYKQYDRSCNMPLTKSYSGGQGSPIAVTQIKPSIDSNKKITLEIHIRNVGNGKVFIKDLNKCPFEIDFSNMNKIKVDSVKLGNTKLSCNPKEVYIPESSDGIFICSGLIKEKYAYQTNINVDLSYNYFTSIKKPILIEKGFSTK